MLPNLDPYPKAFTIDNINSTAASDPSFLILRVRPPHLSTSGAT